MRVLNILVVSLLMSALVLPMTGRAEDTALDTIIVIGVPTAVPDAGLAGSIDTLSQDELAYERVNDTLELFNKVPGVYVARYNQGVINTDIAIRGFAGDGVTPHAKLLIDGIPSNYHNGYNELDQLSPLNIASISTFKGTSDARYGLYNIAGNYNVFTRQDEGKEVDVMLGSFNAREVNAYAGYEDEGFKQNYAFGYRESEGYRSHTDVEKLTLSGSWAWVLDGTRELRLVLRHATYEADSPGYLGKDQSRLMPKLSPSYASADGGDKQTDHLSLHWSQIFAPDLDWHLKLYTQKFERNRWVRFSEAGSLRNRIDDQQQDGFISTLSWTLSPIWTLDWGLDYEQQDVLEQRFQVAGQTRVLDISRVRRNHSYNFDHYGTYVKLSHEAADRIKWNIGLRADRLSGDFIERESGEKRDMYEFGTILQPKFNIIYAATTDVNLFANIGRSFQHPFAAAAYTAGDRKARDVSINDGWEIGTSYSPSARLNLRVSYWQHDASDEFITVDGISRNVGETERNGYELAFNGALNEDWSYWGNYAAIDTKIIKSSTPENNGNELLSIPDYTASFGVNYQASPRLITRIHVDAQGDYYVNEANLGGKFGDYMILSFSADYDLGEAWLNFS